MRRCEGFGSVVWTSTRSMFWPRVRSRFRSTIGFEMETPSPVPPGPGPSPLNRPLLRVGTKIGMTTARPVAVKPILRVEARTVCGLTLVPTVSTTRPVPEICLPQLDSRRDSSLESRKRKLTAPATKVHQGTPPSRMLTGAVYMASSGRPAAGTRRSPQARKSMTTAAPAPATTSNG